MSETEEDTNYWLEVDKRYQREKLQEIVNAHRENVELSAIVNELKGRLPVGLHDKVREQVTNQIPPSARIESFIRVRTEEALNSIVEPIAKLVQRKRKGLKGLSSKATYKQNSCQLTKVSPLSTITNPQQLMASRDQLRKRVTEQEERLEKIVEQRNLVINQDPSTIYLYPEAVNALDSTIMSYDYAAFDIGISGYGTTGYFPPMPMEKEFRMQWVNDILSGKILTDKDVENERRTIRELLQKLSAPIKL